MSAHREQLGLDRSSDQDKKGADTVVAAFQVSQIRPKIPLLFPFLAFQPVPARGGPLVEEFLHHPSRF